MKNLLLFLFLTVLFCSISNAQLPVTLPPLSFELVFKERLPKGVPMPMGSPEQYTQFVLQQSQNYDSLYRAYKNDIDQLEKEQRTLVNDTLLLKYLHDIIIIRIPIVYPKKFLFYDDTSKVFMDKQLTIAKRINHEQYEIEAYDLLEAYYFMNQDFVEALDIALERARRCDKGFKTSCEVCNLIPQCYLPVAKYYAFLNDPESAIEYYNKGINGSKSKSEKELTQTEFARFYLSQKQPEKALEIIHRLESDTTTSNYFYQFFQKAHAYTQLKQYEKALVYINRAMEVDRLRERGGQPFSYDSILYNGLFAQIYLGMDQPQKAFQYIKDDFFDNEYENRFYIAYQIYKQLGNTTQALNALETYKMSSDTIRKIQTNNRLAVLQRKYEVEKVQNIADKERLSAESLRKQRWFLIGGLLLTVVFIGVLAFFYRRIQLQKQQITEFNQGLEVKVQERTTELETALHQVQEAFEQGQMVERKRVSADLHDELGSALSTIGIFSDLAKRKAGKVAPELVSELDRIGTKSRDMVRTMRDTIWVLNDRTQQNLWERMYQHAQETLTAKDIAIDWQVPMNGQSPDVPFGMKRTLFLAFKEALNNIVKHANASKVKVVLQTSPETWQMNIQDDGQGFDPAIAIDKGNGLRNFEDRMVEIGGKATIESKVGEGTEVTFTIPVNP